MNTVTLVDGKQRVVVGDLKLAMSLVFRRRMLPLFREELAFEADVMLWGEREALRFRSQKGRR